MIIASKTTRRPLRIGFLRLTDAAPVIVAHEFGFFAEERVETELVREPSWANIADKLAYGFLDAAVIVPPLAFAVELGLRGAAQPLLIPCAISLAGNTITLARDLAARVRDNAAHNGASVSQTLATLIKQSGAPLPLGVVHTFSTHNLLLRYWLASAGLDLERDVKLFVVPPELAGEALQSRQIVGFCAGAPWGEVAARAGVGATVATSNDVWCNAPEKALAVRKSWADESPETLHGAIRALIRGAQFCDAPENASYSAALLSRRKYLDVDSHAILSSLPGGAITPENVSTFYRNAAPFPWRSHALWFLQQMIRWKLVESTIDAPALAARMYRPDIFRDAIAPLGVPVPLADMKTEGTHTGAWSLDGAPEPIAMGPDRFCDGATFAP
jgi:NitT/TauT family transport system ATP-binding protein/nitrate/nitrite transport system substrate-binding protein